MKAADLKVGDVVKTEGYWEAGDNGAATYEIMTYETWYEQLPDDIKFVRPESKLIETPVDEYGNHTLENGLVAKIYGNSHTPEQWGAKDGANLMPFIHMFAQVKNGRIDFQENKVYELELIAKDNPYRWYMCGALLGGQYFYKPIMGNVQDLILDGHNCTITIPDGKFGDSGMGILNFARNIVNLEIKNFNFDGKGHTMFWENKNSNNAVDNLVTVSFDKRSNLLSLSTKSKSAESCSPASALLKDSRNSLISSSVMCGVLHLQPSAYLLLHL